MDGQQCPCKTAESREAAMVVLDPGTPERHGRDGVWCDPCIAPLVKALNDGGVRTVASCCGHEERDGSILLADGRELLIRPPVPCPSCGGHGINAASPWVDCRRCSGTGDVLDPRELADMAARLEEEAMDWEREQEWW